MKRIAVIAVTAVMILNMTACGKNTKPASVQLFAMDTVMTLTGYGKGGEAAVQQSSTVLSSLEGALSRTRADSFVSQLNEANGEAVSAQPRELGLLQAAVEYSEATNGALDITIAPIADAWGFTKELKQVPAQEELVRLMAKIGIEHIHIEGEQVWLDQGTQIDLGAVAKGYASDLMEALFRKTDTKNALVELGGNIFLLGSKTDGSPWRTGIKDPNHPEQICAVLELEDAFAITSGGYQRNFEENGKTYHHIIDPSTGYPAESGLVSVTVVAPANGENYSGEKPGNGAMSDAFSTALFVMGEKAALDFWRSSGYDFDLVLVTDDARIVVTDGLSGRFEPVDQSGYAYETAPRV